MPFRAEREVLEAKINVTDFLFPDAASITSKAKLKRTIT
jgi:hypothetical protein